MAFTIKFSTLKEISQAVGTLAHGITPGAIRLDFPKQAKPITAGGDLSIEFGGKRVVWRDCLIDQSADVDDRTGRIESIIVFDRRWKWQYQSTSFAFNIRNEANEIRARPGADKLRREGRTDEEIAIIQQFYDTRKSAREIGKFLLGEMGEANNVVANELPDDVYPEFEDEEVRPANALARLCDLFRCTIVLRTDDKVAVHKLGEGARLPQRLNIIREAGAVDLNARPEKVRIVTAPILYQWDMRLEAVGEDIDGNFRPIDELDYKPADGWGGIFGLLRGTLNIDQNDDDAQETARIANRSVFKAYRPLYRGGLSNGIDDPMIVITPAAEQKETRVVVYDQIAPLKNRIVPTVFKQGARRPQEPIIYGQHYDLRRLAVNVTDADFDIPSVLEPLKSKSIVKTGWAIDAKNGLIWFSSPMFLTDDEDHPTPAHLFLRAAFHLKDTISRARNRYELTARIKPPVSPGVVLTQVVEELEPKVRYDFKKIRKEAGADEAVIVQGQPVRNFATIQKEALPYLEAIKRKIEDATGPENVLYEGLVDIIELDGAIRSLTWSCSRQGATTRAQRNQDLGSAVTLSSQELRAIELEAEIERWNARKPSERLRRKEIDRSVDQM